jgi:hypothetical protein
MANIQTINIGNLVNDGLGDDLRTAFQKVNANFADLNNDLSTTASNLGSVGAGIFKQKVANDLQFKKLVPGTKITLADNTDSITVNNSAPDAFTRIDTDAGTVSASTYQNITLEGVAAPLSETGVQDIEVTTTGSSVRFKTIIPVTEYLTTYDFGPLGNTYENALQLALTAANIDFGTLTYNSDINLDCGNFS